MTNKKDRGRGIAKEFKPRKRVRGVVARTVSKQNKSNGTVQKDNRK